METRSDRISLEDCINGTGLVKKITSKEIFGYCEKKEFKTPVKNEKIFKFGKYRGRNYSDIEIEDPWYMNWCRENIANFK